MRSLNAGQSLINSKQNSLKTPIDNLLYAALNEAAETYNIELDFDEFALELMLNQRLHADKIYVHLLSEMKSMSQMNELAIPKSHRIYISQSYILNLLQEKGEKVVQELPAAEEELEKAKHFLDITEQTISTLQETGTSERLRIGIKEIAFHLKEINYFQSSAADADSIRQLFYKERDKLKRAIREQLKNVQNSGAWPKSKKLKPFRNLLDN